MTRSIAIDTKYDSGWAFLYGSPNWVITSAGEIYDSDLKLVSKVFGRGSETRHLKLTFPNGKSISYTLPQLLMYSFYGYVDAPIRLKYPESTIDLKNCAYTGDVRYDSENRTFHIGNDSFKFIRRLFRMSASVYINRHGAAIAVRMSPQFELKFIPWSIQHGYPRYNCDELNSLSVHTAVYDAYGTGDIYSSPNMEVHHKDQCRWNAFIDNLECIPKREHAAEHGRIRQERSSLSEIEIRYICEHLEKGESAREIANRFSEDKRGIVDEEIRRMRNKNKHADIVKDYDKDAVLRDYVTRTYDAIPEATIRMAGEMLSSTDPYYNLEAIEQATGLSNKMLRAFRRKEIADNRIRKILSEYKIVSYEDYLTNYNVDDTVRKTIVDLYADTNLTVNDVAKITEVPLDVVSRIVSQSDKPSKFTKSQKYQKTRVIRVCKDGTRITIHNYDDIVFGDGYSDRLLASRPGTYERAEVRNLSDDEVHRICKMLCENATQRSILETFAPERRSSVEHEIHRIKTVGKYKDIVSQYDMSLITKDRDSKKWDRVPEADVRKACEMLSSINPFYTVAEVRDTTGLSITLLYQMRNGSVKQERFRNIMKDYKIITQDEYQKLCASKYGDLSDKVWHLYVNTTLTPGEIATVLRLPLTDVTGIISSCPEISHFSQPQKYYKTKVRLYRDGAIQIITEYDALLGYPRKTVNRTRPNLDRENEATTA